MEPENFVPMVHRDGYYEVLLRGGVRVPEEHYADLCVTEEYVLCCYRTRCYELNLPTTFFTPHGILTDVRTGWGGLVSVSGRKSRRRSSVSTMLTERPCT